MTWWMIGLALAAEGPWAPYEVGLDTLQLAPVAAEPKPRDVKACAKTGRLRGTTDSVLRLDADGLSWAGLVLAPGDLGAAKVEALATHAERLRTRTLALAEAGCATHRGHAGHVVLTIDGLCHPGGRAHRPGRPT